MKNVLRFFLVSLILVSSFSCQKELDSAQDVDTIVPEGMMRLTLKATSENTKTTISGDGHTLWAAEDKISVVANDNSISDPFDLTGGANTASATFTGNIPNGTSAVYAVYPAGRISSVSGTTVKVSIPSSREGDFGSGNIAVSKVSGGSLTFKNVTAFISFTLPAGTDVTSVVVESVDGSPLAGDLSVDCSGSTPAPTTTIENAASSITTTTSSGAGTYYIAIAPGVAHAKGFKMSYKKGEDVTGVYYLNRNITTTVNTNYQMGEVETKGNYYVTVDGAGDKNGMSWTNAMSAAQMWKKLHLSGEDAAVDGVKFASINGAKFLLAAGTYDWGAASIGNTSNPIINIDETDEVSFTIEGGYNASTGTRDIASNETIFTGDDDSDGVGDHRVLILEGNMNLRLSGITFTKGKSVGSGDARFGGGVRINSGSYSFVDCSFSDNQAVFGGAIRFVSAGTLTLTRTSFSGNEATTGDAGALSIGAGTVTITDCSFTGNTAPAAGAIDCWKDTEIAPNITIIGGEFRNNRATGGNGGAIYIEPHVKFNIYTETVYFVDNYASKNGGALCIESGTENRINEAIFKGNHAENGGAVAVSGGSSVFFNSCIMGGSGSGEPNYANAFGGAVYHEGSNHINIGYSSLVGNYATYNNGGAIAIRGGNLKEEKEALQLFRDSFSGNHAGSGGAVYAGNDGGPYPDIFIDECSFDGNYITTNWGCLFNFNYINNFCMHNCSVRNSYLTANEDGEKACWIDLDHVQGITSISNCSIIGDTKKSTSTVATSSSLVWSCGGSWTDYITNSIILQSSSSLKSIHSDGTTLDVNFTIYSNGDGISTAVNNTSGKASGNLDGLSWSDDSSSSYYWKWSGTIGGVTPPMPTQSAVNTRVDGICHRFVDWSGTDFNKDQRNVNRTGSWWPGAYQTDI